jgi:transcriptional regulator with XRE-family HTH domain
MSSLSAKVYGQDDPLAVILSTVTEQYRAQVGRRLRQLRAGKDLSQENAAHELSVTTKTLSRWEHGETWPRYEHWAAIRNLYGEDPRTAVPDPQALGLGAPITNEPDKQSLVQIAQALERIDQRLAQFADYLASTDEDADFGTLVLRTLERGLQGKEPDSPPPSAEHAPDRRTRKRAR